MAFTASKLHKETGIMMVSLRECSCPTAMDGDCAEDTVTVHRQIIKGSRLYIFTND